MAITSYCCFLWNDQMLGWLKMLISKSFDIVFVIKSLVPVQLEWTEVQLLTDELFSPFLSLFSVQRHQRLGKDGRHRQVRASCPLYHCMCQSSFDFTFLCPYLVPCWLLCSIKSPALQPGAGCHVSVLGKALWVKKKKRKETQRPVLELLLLYRVTLQRNVSWVTVWDMIYIYIYTCFYYICAGDALSVYLPTICEFWLTFLPFHISVSLSSKDQAEMDPTDMEDVEDVEEEETGEDENSKGWYLHSVFQEWRPRNGSAKSFGMLLTWTSLFFFFF